MPHRRPSAAVKLRWDIRLRIQDRDEMKNVEHSALEMPLLIEG